MRLVIFDEAHQSIARTYQRIIEDLEDLKPKPRCWIIDVPWSLLGLGIGLGLTATPGRTWADIDKDGDLADFYAHNKIGLEVPGENPIEYLIANGFLARPTFRTLLAEPGLQISEQELARISQALDIPDEVRDTLSMSQQYVTAVLEAIEGLVGKGHRRVLVFAATVRHARIMTAILAARRIRSAVVTGSTPERERGRAISAFTRDDEDPMVLVNFGVLTTGFDAPGG